MSDTEKDAVSAEGYDRLGRLMSEVPDVAIFRRFGALSAEDLLYRQAELAELEEALRQFQHEDKTSGDAERSRYHLNWEKLKHSGDADAPVDNAAHQLSTVMEIRAKLKDYHEALLRHRQILELGTAIPLQVKTLNEYMTRPEQGNIFLQGPDRHTWSDEKLLSDLVTLAPPSPGRALTSNRSLKLVQLYNRFIGRHVHKPAQQDFLRNTIIYSDGGAFLLIKTVATLVACLLPIVGIVVLWKIQDMAIRLAAVAIFTAAFSVSLSLLSTSNIQQIFASTATFAAVLVVFVGTSEVQKP